jgi:hypothetical protein
VPQDAVATRMSIDSPTGDSLRAEGLHLPK